MLVFLVLRCSTEFRFITVNCNYRHDLHVLIFILCFEFHLHVLIFILHVLIFISDLPSLILIFSICALQLDLCSLVAFRLRNSFSWAVLSRPRVSIRDISSGEEWQQSWELSKLTVGPLMILSYMTFNVWYHKLFIIIINIIIIVIIFIIRTNVASFIHSFRIFL